MTVKSLFLGGAALAAVLCSSTPGFAQYAGNPPQVSTPAEQQETQALNQRYTDGTDQSPAALNGEGQDRAGPPPNDNRYRDQPPPSDDQSDAGPPPSDAGAQYGNQREQYDQQRAQYEQNQQRYQDQQDRYQAQRNRYIHDLRRYDLARYEWTDWPRVYVYEYSSRSVHPLYLIADPTHQLWNAPVEGPSGRFVGKVRNVETGPDGRPMRVEVALNRMVSVWVRPGDLRFDPSNHVVFTDLTRDDLWNMPGATIESGDVYRD
jgi:hypothetical protein